VTGLIGPPGVAAYVAAKHGQVGLLRTAAKELAARRIRVNTLHPGPTSTPFQDDIEMRATGQSRDEAAKIFDGMIPLGRHTTPEEVAHAVLYLASDESAMVTSHTLSIDGGMSG
jgi:NAD(P)-dependent dehydrogenase (short-subunit alcohol dehydrogenase family)